MPGQEGVVQFGIGEAFAMVKMDSDCSSLLKVRFFDKLVIKLQCIFRNAVKWKCCLYKGPCLKYTSDATISSYYARTGIPFRHSSKFFYIQR